MARLALMIAAMAFAANAFAAEPPAAGRAKPNIVLFIADDLSWHDCGPYGAKDVRTPNLDRLAREGMTFNHAFAASPTCTPSRCSIYSGLYPFRHGAHANHSLVRDDLRTLPSYLRELGYRVVLAGKTHIGPREVFPFDYLKGSNIMPPGKDDVLWTDLNMPLIEREIGLFDGTQPLCLIVAAHSPHVIWMDNDGYDASKIFLPPYLLDTHETREARCRYYSDVTWMDKQLGQVMDAVAKNLPNTLMMFTADHGAQWPFAKWTLYDAGIRVPLIVRFPDHVKPSTTSDVLVSLVDLLPTMVAAAGGNPPNDLDGRNFLSSEFHRDEIYASHTGDGRMNRSPMRCIRTAKFKYIANLVPQNRYKSHISEPAGKNEYWPSWVKLAEHDPEAAKVVERFHHQPPEELYDVQADPYELKNLAGDPAYSQTLAELREKLKAWRLQQGEMLAKVPMPEDARIGDIRYAE